MLRAWQTFSKVSVLVLSQQKVTIESTFENARLALLHAHRRLGAAHVLELELLLGYLLGLDGCPLTFLPSNMKIQTQRIALLRPRIKLCARTL